MSTDALNQVHPDLVDLMIRLELLPERSSHLTEAFLARSIYLALDLAEPDEQACLISRLIPAEDMAVERLRSPEVQNTNHRVVLDHVERSVAFRDNVSEPVPQQENGNNCLICYGSAHVKANCGCDYCLPCFRSAIRIGLCSQEVFPPRCCQPFGEEDIVLAQSPALVHLFRQMKEEADIPIHDRLYCSDGHCAAFIPPDCKGDCLLCDSRTCTDCFAKAHPKRPCERGEVEEDVWESMDRNHIVNCPGCGRMIQLKEACNHMRCVCGQHFCYICGEIWRQCACPEWGHFDRMVPIRHRPGVKPPQFRRRQRRTEALSTEATAKIPQLRPLPGQEDRVPKVTTGRNRVIRPLRLPQQEQQKRQLERRERQQRDEMLQHRQDLHEFELRPRVPRGTLAELLQEVALGAFGEQQQMVPSMVPKFPLTEELRNRQQDQPQRRAVDVSAMYPMPIPARHQQQQDVPWAGRASGVVGAAAPGLRFQQGDHGCENNLATKLTTTNNNKLIINLTNLTNNLAIINLKMSVTMNIAMKVTTNTTMNIITTIIITTSATTNTAIQIKAMPSEH
ncbi:e3 ubiquitin ligase ARI4 [Fusarium heterosporum]|uniref:RBR-type E3 ubiquitin transferase n=1 Tax=Fusarium heterosporum TaxID=42747 RepID=A0A8H5SXM9_FUSHE|nr:e3 ubiquitin ligase ARI4 [Fusarium heterosporum]